MDEYNCSRIFLIISNWTMFRQAKNKMDEGNSIKEVGT